ncbi:cation diffusion facilitator family transporter [Sphingobacterium sp. SRCM116780]|uniref:cation diffusion facilitator family transporter n=1 Tax=Sphingobacterium sp. SRCM116780 TaxID=2907623 RepID=UPI001F45AFB0|nr:cation diffusion facilitator family transporter [Sphingobacterium sp. SRCM116780]UIR57037.1 cation diffusion facilitator family transporter [Sphingobacterium sp. SRCM116780]
MSKQKRLVLLSLMTGLGLMIIKFVAYFLTASNAIFTDAAESIVNVIASSFAFYSIHLASQPKDGNHPYGHGKVEFFSVFLEGGLIFIAGSIILVKACYNIFFPSTLANLEEGISLIAITGFINFAIGFYIMKRGRALGSLTLEADGKHLQVDAYSTFGLIVGLILMKLTGLKWIDLGISFVLGGFILYSGYKLLRQSIGGLMDESDVEIIKEVVDVLQENRKPDWIDIHNFRVQRYGHELHVDCHLTLPNYYSLTKVHDEISILDKTVNTKMSIKTEFFIHADPCLPECCHYCQVKDCPIRSTEFQAPIEWTVENVTPNRKHFLS